MKLDPKKAKFVKAKAEGKSNREAGLIAGAESPVAADQYANRMLKDVKVQDALQEAMVKAGITTELIVQPVADALNDTDLEMRLKGHDRAVKLVMPKNEGSVTNINFGTVIQEQKDKYGL